VPKRKQGKKGNTFLMHVGRCALAFQRPTKKGNYKGYGHVEFTPIEDVFAVTKTYVKKDFLIVRIKARPMRKFLMGMVEAQNANGQHQKGKKK